MLQYRVTLTVQPEVGVILSFNEPKSALVAITTPWLDGEWLVQIVFMSLLLV